jgi:hypothetical protein
MSLYRILIWSVTAISTLGHIAATLVLLFSCRPVHIIPFTLPEP